MATVYSLVCENGSSGSYWSNLSTDDRLRYGPAGSERVYDGLIAWYNARKAVLDSTPQWFDTEICEIGDAFVETTTGYLSFAMNCAAIKIVPTVDDVITAAFPGGSVVSGYQFSTTSTSCAFRYRMFNVTVTGIRIHISAGGADAVDMDQMGGKLTKCIISGDPSETSQMGVIASDYLCKIANNLVYNIGGTGIYVYSYSGKGSRIHNNTVTKCALGMDALSTSNGMFWNNLVVGNTKNWGKQPGYTAVYSNNYGEPSDIIEITSVDVDADTVTAPGHGFTENYEKISFTSSGDLPAPLLDNRDYVVRDISGDTFAITFSTYGAPIDLTTTGSGTITFSKIWSEGTPGDFGRVVDMSDPDSVFQDYAGNDFRPSDSAAVQVETGVEVYDGDTTDITNAARPNYIDGVSDKWDGGCFEFDHGNGLAPKTVSVEISGIITGSDLAIYKSSDNTEIVAPTIISGSSFSTTYTYTGDTVVTVKIRNSSGATKYKPYAAQGVISENGLSMIVAQIENPIAK